jgi:hypothetical protein
MEENTGGMECDGNTKGVRADMGGILLKKVEAVGGIEGGVKGEI